MNKLNSADAGPHVCEVCERFFKNIYSLRRHVKVVHEGCRPHLCECGKSFATKEQFSRHRNSKHTFQKPYRCEKGCERSFASYTARDYHHRVVHDQVKFSCPVLGCTKKYSSKIHLINHMKKPHFANFMSLQVLNTLAYWLVPGDHLNYFIQNDN